MLCNMNNSIFYKKIYDKAMYQSTDFVVVVEQVLRCLFKIMQTDPLWKIKALAIRGIVLLNF